VNDRRRAIIPLHKHGEHPGGVFHRKRAAAIGGAETVAAHPFHAEHVRFRMCLAELVTRHQYLEKGQISQSVRQPHFSLFVRQQLLLPEPESDIARVIPPGQSQVRMGDGHAVLAVQNAHSDRVVVHNGEDLIRLTQRCPRKGQKYAYRYS